jgi:phosphoribosyl-AMP cyclohydrolase
MPEGITIDATAEQLAGLKYNSDGLITAIAQDVENGDILMLAWMNEESLKMTFPEGRMVYR